MKKYKFSEDNRESCLYLMGRTFTEPQLKEVYRDIIDKEEYPDFTSWFSDMKKSDLILEVMDKELQLLDSIEEIRQKAIEHPERYPIDFTIRVITAMVAEYVGYESRYDWTDELKKHADSKYAQRLAENRFHL